ncbi:CAF17-like 4Fe-4S cluster assembly/insertion protein YgfZ [Solimonas marina]|uniref:Folate-binding protein YgfZ n=1 Tax=Solimonas marina TaxID=2714601 RepID=A0A969W711_9GAMM|nr:folate-binding protein YgfZ [Solimonas marina]NKF21782.1 folate-binding protein YgfZ [Solimonas marina]
MNSLITDTTERVWLRISGADAETFLQGQLSNDIGRLSTENAQISSYNSAKGRMLAVLLLVRVHDEIFIELPRAIAEATLKRLKMFVLRSKVTIVRADDIDALAVLGDGAADALAALDLPAPEAPLACAAGANGLTVVRRLGTSPRYSVLGAADAIAALRARLPPPGLTAEGTHWRRADIDAGVPVVWPETSDHFVAQMANLDQLGGISFDKGCYTGQEIIARLHYLGQLKRRMFTARIAAAAPAPGSAIFADGETQAAGEIVDAVDDGDGLSVATLVLQLGARERRLSLEGGAAITLVESPSA